MARKQQLLDVIDQHLKFDNHGSLKTRQYRLFALMKIINAFYELRMVPANWHVLTTRNVTILVEHWKKNGLKNTTIMNYLVALRYFLNKINHDVPNIDNVSLSLTKNQKISKPFVDGDEYLSKIKEPIAYLLFALQIKFGLTLNEALHIIPGIHFDEDSLWVTREISVNHQDRILPMVTAQQHDILAALRLLTGQNNSLIMRFGEHNVRLAYRLALSTLHLSTRIGYRYLYAKARFDVLCRLHDNSESRKIIIKEMSINNTSAIWKIIYEQY